MTDHDDSDPDRHGDDLGRVEEPRSEGVRIIGAQEAAQATDRPGVTRRRRRDQKRYGDRPDAPSATEDLPRVRISTSDPVDLTDADLAGSPVVAPRPDEPRWAEGEGHGLGHARALPNEQTDPEPDDGPTDEPWVEPDAGQSSESTRDTGTTSEPVPSVEDEWRLEDAGPDPFAASDDSFVLPHWTEPPTGQVPKVVIGDDADEQEWTGGHASTPRWRDAGEREVDTGFDDLLDDAPRLGALGGEDPFGDPVDDDGFDDESGRDPIEAFAPEDDGFTTERPARRRGRPGTRREPDDATLSDGDGDGDGGGIGGDRDLVKAVGVGVALVVLGLVCFALGGLATTLVACVIVGIAAAEYFGAVESAGFHPAGLVGLVATVGLLLATYFTGLNAYSVVLPLTVIVSLLWYLWIQPGAHRVSGLAVTVLGVMWIGFLGSFATLMLGLGKVAQDRTGASSNIGLGVVIAAVVVAVSHDVGAYFIGRYFGKNPLSKASPNKTLEGTAGGIGTAVVVTTLVVGIGGIAPIGGDIFRVFVFALLCSIVAPLGDLCESFVKRDLGIKDMGVVLPGHGGVLDRFDALLFVLPTAYFLTLLFGTWTVR